MFYYDTRVSKNKTTGRLWKTSLYNVNFWQGEASAVLAEEGGNSVQNRNPNNNYQKSLN